MTHTMQSIRSVLSCPKSAKRSSSPVVAQVLDKKPHAPLLKPDPTAFTSLVAQSSRSIRPKTQSKRTIRM